MYNIYPIIENACPMAPGTGFGPFGAEGPKKNKIIYRIVFVDFGNFGV